jgi:hypothetical protein
LRPRWKTKLHHFYTILPGRRSRARDPNSGTKTAPFLHRFSAAKELKSRISNHLRISTNPTGAIRCHAEVGAGGISRRRNTQAHMSRRSQAEAELAQNFPISLPLCWTGELRDPQLQSKIANRK